MESGNYLGIYLSKDTATVVCLDPQGKELLGCFSVSAVEEQQEEQVNPGMSALASLIAQGCAERELGFSDVAVALDCSMFMQHNVHSEFSDTKQLNATVRFDTEEALATDISNIALAFQKMSSDQSGSDLMVFTAQRKVLSEIILSLQSNAIDPVTIEPDVNCLSRFICQNLSFSDGEHTLFGVLSKRNGYLVDPPSGAGQEASMVRTFLVGSAQNRSEILSREVMITTVLVRGGEPIKFLKIFDSADSVNFQQLSERLDTEVSGVDWLEAGLIAPEDTEAVDFAIACGAALTHLDKAERVNFRDDFMPYQGKKLRLQKTLKFTAISATVLLIALGLFFQSQLTKVNKYRNALYDKFVVDYSAVMQGKIPSRRLNPVTKLKSEVRRIRNIKSGLLEDEQGLTISAKLTKVIEAFNKCAAQTKLVIDTITVTTRNISVSGSTSKRNNSLLLFDKIRENRFDVVPSNLKEESGRDKFLIQIIPKQ